MHWSGRHCCVSCDPYNWKAINYSPVFCSSHRNSTTLTVPRQASRQPNLADLLAEMLKTANRKGLYTHLWFVIILILLIVVSKARKLQSCIDLMTYAEKDPTYFNTQHLLQELYFSKDFLIITPISL